MTPDKTLFTDTAILFVSLILFSALAFSLCSTEESIGHTSSIADPIETCAEYVKALHPRHQSILVHGSPRREEVNHGLALWYCRKLTPRGVESAMRALNPLTAEELATW